MISSFLDNIEGIGNKRKNELLKKYSSINKLNEASVEELSTIVPLNVANNLKKFAKEYKEEKNDTTH